MKYQELVEEMRRMTVDLWGFLLEFLPKLILGLVILFLGYLIARLAQFLVGRLIGHLDRIINKNLSGRQLQVSLKSSRNFISKAFFWIILFFFLTVFTETLGLPVITSWLAELGNYLPNLLAGLLIVFIGIIFSRLASDLIKSRTFKSGSFSSALLGKVVKFIILIISIVIAVDQVGVDISFLTSLTYIILASLLLGAAMAFGVGAKSSVSNILASFYISRTYSEGNYIRIGKYEGRIIKISATAVFLESEVGQIVIPAKDFNDQKSILIKK